MQFIEARKRWCIFALFAVLTTGPVYVDDLSRRRPAAYVAAPFAPAPIDSASDYTKPSPFALPAPPHPSRRRRIVITAEQLPFAASDTQANTREVR